MSMCQCWSSSSCLLSMDFWFCFLSFSSRSFLARVLGLMSTSRSGFTFFCKKLKLVIKIFATILDSPSGLTQNHTGMSQQQKTFGIYVVLVCAVCRNRVLYKEFINNFGQKMVKLYHYTLKTHYIHWRLH